MNLTIKGKGSITLSKNDFKGSGGQGTVYCKGKMGYKVYHDPGKMIPPGKIDELKELSKIPNVLAPMDLLLDGGTPVGFTMPYVDGVEYLCRLFTKTYRDDNGISPQMIADLVKNLQKTLIEIHRHKCLVVDYNELNFLVSFDYTNPYYIDVDSYKTPSYPPNALMESVRDRLVSNGKFTEFSDWFSFAIVAFQLYMGIHPYKGRHPDYKPKEWIKMMDDNISVYHQGVRLPAGCQDWAVIPKRHNEWFKKVFENRERSIPPFADAPGPVATPQPVLIPSNEDFEISLVQSYSSNIRGAYYLEGVRYAIGAGEIYADSKSLLKFPVNQKAAIGRVIGSTPFLALFSGNKARFCDIQGNEIASTNAEAIFNFDNRVYSISYGNMVEHSCSMFQKLVHHTKIVGNIFTAYDVFDGVVAQNILGTCWLAIPYKEGSCLNLHIKEADGFRIIDAKFDATHAIGYCSFIGELRGSFKRFFIRIDLENPGVYSLKVDDSSLDKVNFTLLHNGICVSVIEDIRVEVFAGFSKIKTLADPPFDSSMRLYHEGSKVMFINRTKIHSISLKGQK